MSGIRICLDTNVFIDVINKEKPYYHKSKDVLAAVERKQVKAIVPTLVIAEVLTGFYIDRKENLAEEFLSAMLANEYIEIAPLSVEIATKSASVRAKTNLRLPDSIVLATAVYERVDILVSNDARFPKKFENLAVLGSNEFVSTIKRS